MRQAGSGVLLLVVVVLVLAIVVPSSTAASGDLKNHGGPVVRAGDVYVIFWLPPGRHFDPRSSDASFESFVRRGVASLGGSSWWATLSQYGARNGLEFGGSWVDSTPYPHAGTSGAPLRSADFRAPVERALAANGWRPGLDRIYLVITANDTEACGLDTLVGSGLSVSKNAQPCTLPVSSSNACAGHSFFSIQGRQVLYAILPESSNRGCTPDPSQSPNHDIRADEAITVGAALLAETAVDPLGTGWYVRSAPVGLLCNIDSPVPLHLHSDVYALLGLHSNAQHACVHGYPPLGLSASLSSPTARAGARDTLTVTTAPGAGLYLHFGNGGGTRDFAATADAHGLFRYSWLVRAQPRQGFITVTATRNGRSGSSTVQFQVAA